MLVFEESGKPEFPEKNLSEQSREPTNSVHTWRQVRDSNPGHIGGRRTISPLRQSCSPKGAHWFTGTRPEWNELRCHKCTIVYYCLGDFFLLENVWVKIGGKIVKARMAELTGYYHNCWGWRFKFLGPFFSKATETFRVCETIFSSSVSKKWELFMPETSCMKVTCVNIKTTLACCRLSVSGAYRMRPSDVRRAGSGRERGKVGSSFPRPPIFFTGPRSSRARFSIDPTNREPGTG